MMVELGGGTKPHPRADVVIDWVHPVNSPPQDAAATPWRMTGRTSSETVDWERMIVNQLTVHSVISAGSADEVYASHFLEHIPKGQPLIRVMNEAHRILRPGGTFTIILPLIGYTDAFGEGVIVNKPGAWADPTHVSHWWFPESIMYFSDQHQDLDADYGILPWEFDANYHCTEAQITAILTDEQGPTEWWTKSWWGVRGGWEGVARLIKPKGTS